MKRTDPRPATLFHEESRAFAPDFRVKSRNSNCGNLILPGIGWFLAAGLLVGCAVGEEESPRPRPSIDQGPPVESDGGVVDQGRREPDLGAPFTDLGAPDEGAGDACPPDGCTIGCREATLVPLTPDTGLVRLHGELTRGIRAMGEVQCPQDTVRALEGRQLVYRLQLSEPGDLDVRLAPAGPGSYLTVLDASCNQTALACQSGAGEFVLPELAVGDYFVLVGGAAEPLDFDLEVRLRESGQNLAGSCGEPSPLLLGEDGSTTAAATLRGTTDHGQGSCSTPGAPDSVHQLSVAAPGAFRFELRTTDGWHGRLFMRRQCGDPLTEVVCGGLDEPIQAALLTGTYSVFVEAEGRTGGSYTLQVTRQPDGAGESCADRQLLFFSPEGVAQVSGDLASAAADLADDSCGSSGSPDQAFALLLGQRAALSIQVTAEGLAGVELRQDCATPGPAHWCTSNAGTLITEVLDPGDYSLILRGYEGQYVGPYSLVVRIIPASQPPRNDGCADPWPLEIDPGLLTVFGEGNTAVAGDDGAGSCGGQGGADLVYRFTLATESNLTLSLRGGFNSILSLRSACADQDTELICLPSGVTQEYRRAAPGEYFVWIDGTGPGDRGEFSFQIAVAEAPPQPVNLDCEHAALLDELAQRGQQRIRADLRDSRDQERGSCSWVDGPELVYRLELPADGELTVQDESGSYPFFYVRQGSCNGPELGCQFANLALARVPAGTSYLFVDGSWSPGVFNALLLYEELPPLQPNDRCENAFLLIPDDQGEARCAGNTAAAAHERGAFCGGNQGPELFYRFELAAPAQVDITVNTRRYNFDGVVYLLNGCGPDAAVLACADDPEELHLPRLEAGIYWLAIDSYQSLGGEFDATLRVSPLAAAGPGQACDRPLVESWDPVDGPLVLTGDAGLGGRALADRACLDAAATLEQIRLLRLAQPTRVELQLEGDPRVRLSLRATCDDPLTGSCLAPGQRSTLELPADEHSLIFRIPAPAGQTQAPYRLTLTPLLPEPAPPGSGCEQPLPLDGRLARQRVVGTTVGAANLRSSACGGSRAGEVAFALELAQPSLLRASLTAHQFSGTLYLAAGDCLAGPLMGPCGPVLRTTLEPGRYLLFVDGTAPGATGDFNIVVELSRVANLGEPCDPAGGGCLDGAYCLAVPPALEPTCFGPNPAQQVLWAAETNRGQLLRLHPATGMVLERFPAPAGLKGPSCGLALAPDGQLLLVDGGSPEQGIQLIDPFTGALTNRLQNPAGAGAAGLGRHGGDLVLADAAASLLRVLAPATGEQIFTVPLPAADQIGGLEVRNGEALVTLRQGGSWQLLGQPLRAGDPRATPLPDAQVAVGQAGPLLYLASTQAEVTLFDPATLRQVGRFSLPEPALCGLAGSEE